MTAKTIDAIEYWKGELQGLLKAETEESQTASKSRTAADKAVAIADADKQAYENGQRDRAPQIARARRELDKALTS